MNLKRWASFSLLFLLVEVRSFAKEPTLSSEPTYNGKPLSHWIEHYYHHDMSRSLAPQSPGGHEGLDAIRHIGTNALPFLLKWMVEYDSQIPRKVTLTAEELAVKHRAIFASSAFIALGDEARPAIPRLSQLMKGANGSDLATRALAAIGPAAIPILTERLTNSSIPASGRAYMATYFATYPAIATNGSAVVPTLVKCLNDPDKEMRVPAVDCLGTMAVHDQSQAALVVPALIKYLRDVSAPTQVTKSDTYAQCRTMYALAAYGKKAKEAAPLMLSLCAAPDRGVRRVATNTLWQISPEILTNAPPK